MSLSEPKEYFTNNFSQEVWHTTYRDHKETNLSETYKRVSSAISSVESDEEKKKEYSQKFLDELLNFRFVPGGRIVANAGTQWKNVGLINCYTGGRPKYDCDSLTGILEVLHGQALTLKSEGGWGLNFSFIRPRGAFIYGVGVESPGPVKFMELFDKSSDVITSGSGGTSSSKKEKKGKIRKGAQMAILSCWHPSIFEYVTAKQTSGKLTKFNMSVYCTDEFMDKVIEAKAGNPDVTWDLVFPNTNHPKYKEDWDGDLTTWKSKGHDVIVYETIPVLKLWDVIIKSTYNRAEPGVLFLDKANKTYCFNYSGIRIQETNACSEQVMPQFSSCNLLSMNLSVLFNKITKQLELDKLAESARIALRFADNVNDLTTVPLTEYENSVRNLRRVGIGMMGWGTLLYMLKIPFASKESEALKETIMKTICYSVIDESVNLAIEKGMFVGCDPEKHADCEYFNMIGLPEEIRARVRKYGVRNSSFFSIQPTGNTSIFANNISGGCEPIYMAEYVRTSIVQDCPAELLGLVPKYWEGEFFETDTFKFAKDGDEQILMAVVNRTTYRIDKSRGLTKDTLCEDYAVSYLKSIGEWDASADWAKTTNNLTVADHITDLKGFTKWLDASCSKTINIPNDYPFEKFEDVYLDAYKTGTIKGITTYRAGTMSSVLKSVDTKEEIEVCRFTKRPKELKCDVYHCRVKAEEYFCLVGLDNCGNPYEVFAGRNGVISKSVESGVIYRQKRGHYQLYSNDEILLDNINKFLTDDGEALTRMTSMSLRHCPTSKLKYIVEQLGKVEGDFTNLSRVISRCLKKYIKDGDTSSIECSSCGQKTLVYSEGCKVCKSCGQSACG